MSKFYIYFHPVKIKMYSYLFCDNNCFPEGL